MDDLTAFFVTTGRARAAEALERLQGEGLGLPVEVIRDVRPMRAAYAHTLRSPTPYTLIVDDDVLLHPGALGPVVDELRAAHGADPAVYRLQPFTRDEFGGHLVRRGLKLYVSEHLRSLGWPEGTHAAWVQRRRAESRGLRIVHSDAEVGLHAMGTTGDVYRQHLWLRIRQRAGQGGAPPLAELLSRARREDTAAAWAACLGLLDGDRVGEVGASKDEALVGPLAAGLDLDAAGAAGLRERCGVALAAG